MIKQEEILEEVILITKDRSMGYQLLKYLHSQDVVIKVEGELPKSPFVVGCSEDEGFYVGRFFMLRASFVATEPLIKESD